MKNNHQIDIPLIFFSFAFFIILIGLFSKLASQKNTSTIQKEQTSVASVAQQKNVKQSKKLDYNLPILCDYKTKDSSVSAAINTDSISIKLTGSSNSAQYVISGDCLYSWKLSEFKGKKKCGIGNYIRMGRQLLSSGLGSIDSIISTLQKTQAASMINIQEVVKSCDNVKEIKKEVFVIPKKILFE